MLIDFNSARRQQITAYRRLVAALNDRLDHEGVVHIDRSDLEEIMDDLKNSVVAIALSYVPDDPDIQDVLGDQVLPDFGSDEDEPL